LPKDQQLFQEKKLKEEKQLRTKIKDKFKRVLLANRKLLLLMRLKPEDLEKAVRTMPLSRSLAHDFLEAAKEGNLKQLKEMHKYDRYLMFEYDQFSQTPLHWAVKRTHPDCVLWMIREGVNIDAKDILGRSALMMAVVADQEDMVVMLILGYANPSYF